MIEEHRRSSDNWGTRAQVLLSALVVLAVLYIEGSMVLYGTPKTVEPVLLGRIIGTLETALMMILGYWFTASASERGKDAALQSMVRQPADSIKTDDVNVAASGDVNIRKDKPKEKTK